MHTLPNGVNFFERGWLSSNNVLIHDEDQAVLVDTGYWLHAKQTNALVTSVLGEKPLTALFNTHLHSDHCGGNSYLQACYPGLATYVPPGHAEFVDSWDEDVLTYRPTGQHCPKFIKTNILHDGDVFVIAEKTWRIYSAPGHDPHSVIIFNETDRILISADALWENGFGVVFPEIEGISAFDEIENTLDIIQKLNPALILPGHGAAFTEAGQALERARSRLAQFRNAPDKHAIYAAKVLLKFKLLELQRIERDELLKWAQSVHYLNLLFIQYSDGLSFESWFFNLCNSLERSGACTSDEMWITNIN